MSIAPPLLALSWHQRKMNEIYFTKDTFRKTVYDFVAIYFCTSILFFVFNYGVNTTEIRSFELLVDSVASEVRVSVNNALKLLLSAIIVGELYSMDLKQIKKNIFSDEKGDLFS